MEKEIKQLNKVIFIVTFVLSNLLVIAFLQIISNYQEMENQREYLNLLNKKNDILNKKLDILYKLHNNE